MNTSVDRTQSSGFANPSSDGGADGKRFVEQAKKTAQDVQQLGSIAGDVAKEKVQHLRESASELKKEARDKALQVERTIEQSIREQPLKSVLIAAGIGLFFGRFCMRR